MTRFAALVLAAGEGRRFGGPKQLADLNGRPLLEHVLEAAASAAGVDNVVVTLGANADEILAAADLRGAQAIRVEDWKEGQAASLRAGVAALADLADAIVVLLGDQPLVTSKMIEAAIAAWDTEYEALRMTFDGRPGHPVILGRPLFAPIQKLRGDSGARQLLGDARVSELAAAPGVVADVDTPAELVAVRELLTARDSPR